MRNGWKLCVGVLVVVLVVGLVLLLYPDRSTVRAQDRDARGRYTVVTTDGTHLVVKDDGANKVYFYSIDQGGKPGDELKFRGTIDLNDVGKPTIQPTKPK